MESTQSQTNKVTEFKLFTNDRLLLALPCHVKLVKINSSYYKNTYTQ